MSDSVRSSPVDLTFRPMTEADIPFGMRLKAQAGWNQTEADWRRFLALAPQGCMLVEADGESAGTAAAICFGPVAWISMVLVDEAQRGRGVGTALMRHLLAHLDEQHVPSVRLDATHLGEPIYRKLGFEDQFSLIRLHRSAVTPMPAQPVLNAAKVRRLPCAATSLDAIAALDHHATRTDRRSLLERLLDEQKQPNHALLAERDGQPTGYLLMRPGSNALQIGPAIARDSDTAIALLSEALNRLGEEAAFIDISADHAIVLDWLAHAGFTEQRRYTRMTRGTPVHEDIPCLLASSGAEKG